MNNLMFCSAGRRGRLLRDAKDTLQHGTQIIATDANVTAPALYFADRAFQVPLISHPDYIDTILGIARDNDVKALTTLIDPEIELLARNRQRFLDADILPLCPGEASARLCFDKFALFRYLTEKGIPTPLTFHDLETFRRALQEGRIAFPVFIKPISGSGSVGAHRVENMSQLEEDFASGEHDYIIQELMTGDCDADVYVDAISGRVVSAFSKRKIETRIGGASKTISFRDPRLFELIERVAEVFEFAGPLDMDFFRREDGSYVLSEINPRFGGAYLHAYGAGVNFFPLIKANMEGRACASVLGNYPDDIVMMMYDDVVIRPLAEMLPGDVATL